MRLADDTRGRVPFALVGVLLLLGSTTYATTLATTGVSVDRDVAVAMDRATAASETALRAAVTRAARDAARTPVVTPASTAWGDVLDESSPFRDSLAARIYVAARRGFDRAAYTHGDVTAAASLPATPTPGTLDSALAHVTVAGAENGTALRVTIRNVSVVARQGGRVVAHETANRTVTVATPVLALHDRTAAFATSIERDPLAGRGLGRRLTARLYPVAWARGYAQWGGLPVSNVVGTRHVGITANGAILELQREAFGRADPTGRAAYRRALLRLGTRDARAGMSTPTTALAASVDPPPSVVDPDDTPPRVPRLADSVGPGPDRQVAVGVNDTADRAYVSLRVGSDGPALADVLERAYTVDVRLRTRANLLASDPWPHPRPPTPGASLEDESVSHDATVEPGDGPRPAAETGWTRFRTDTRRVTVRHRIRWTWARENESVVTTATVRETYAVGVAVDGRPAPMNGTPTRPIRPVFERGGALDGPNLADVPSRADDVLEARGGVDAIAARLAVAGPDALDRDDSIVAVRPSELREWVTADLLALTRTVRNVSTTVRAGDAARGEANPAATLAATLDERRDALVDAPVRYDGVSDRARIAARAAYVDRTHARLAARANATARANDRLADRLRAAGVDLAGRASAVMSNRTAMSREPRPPVGPLGGEDVFVPQGGPPYLDVEGVDAVTAPWTERRATVYPLATRTVNVFTVPYGDAADAVVDAADGTSSVRLHTAAMTLRAAERAAGPDTPELRTRRDHLRRVVGDALVAVDGRTRRVLTRQTTLPADERRRVVDAAFGRWRRTSARALAVTNGSFVAAVVDAADVEGTDADRLRVHLRAAVADLRASPETHVPSHPVESTASAVRRVATTVATEALGTAVATGTDRLADRADGRAVVLPSGLPLLPTPTNWYATVNVWVVTVRGEYPRFAVRTRRGDPGATVTYVRDGGVAAIDVDEDGTAERLGRAERIRFAVRTVILVAVPPGKTGVGDVDGQADERSPGWDQS